MKNDLALFGVGCIFALFTAVSPAGTLPTAKTSVLYVATTGNDKNPGTREKPFATLERAKREVRERADTSRSPIRILLREGTYYLKQTFELHPEDSGTAEAPVTYAAYPGERVTLSGGRRLDCHWRAYRERDHDVRLARSEGGQTGFHAALCQRQAAGAGAVSELRQFAPRQERLHLSGRRHPGEHGGSAARPQRRHDLYGCRGPRHSLRPGNVSRRNAGRGRKRPCSTSSAAATGAISNGGSRPSTTTAAQSGSARAGSRWAPSGTRTRRPSIAGCRFFVENVFEELDAPGEWYLDTAAGILYFMPPPGMDLAQRRGGGSGAGVGRPDRGHAGQAGFVTSPWTVFASPTRPRPS